MGTPLNFEGVIVPVVTPFSLDGEIDSEGLEAQLDWLSGKGVAGIAALGSTGEAVLLEREERARVIEICAANREEGTILLAGSGGESTAVTLAYARDASQLGADAIMVLTPSYYKAQMTSQALCDHFTIVADNSDLPVILYNMPTNTGINLSAEAAEELSAHPNIIGLKDSNGDLRNLQQYLERTPPEFNILVGSALIMGAAVSAGAVGGIIAMANAVPEICVELFERARTGDMDGLLELQPRLGFLTRAVQGRFGIAGIKAAADMLGGRGGPPRPPLPFLSEEDEAAIETALKEGGLIS
jgi:4-hydroxy-2-oxoglutarate aldolase